MNKFFSFVMYALWILSLIGILVITFTNFQYSDLNAIVIILFVFTLANTFFTLKQK
ncbi:MAG: hypothetical protein WC676_01335 [Candidatus Omnitrophota bacterium]